MGIIAIFLLIKLRLQVSTNGISSRLVRLKLTAKVLTDSNNTSTPEFALTSSYSDLGNAIQKSGAKQISYEGGNVIKTYALAQNYPNPFSAEG